MARKIIVLVIIVLSAALMPRLEVFGFTYQNPQDNPPNDPGGIGAGLQGYGMENHVPYTGLNAIPGMLSLIEDGLSAFRIETNGLLAHSLSVAGALTVTNSVHVDNNLVINNTLTVDGRSLINTENPSASYGFLLATTTIQGNLSVTGSLTKYLSFFVIDHPLDPLHKTLTHAAIESNEMKNIYHGVTVLDKNGEAAIQLPNYFEALNRNFRYQFTSIGVSAPNLALLEPIRNHRFKIGGGSAGTKVSWQVTGVRQDAFAVAHPLIVIQKKATPGYLYPELYPNIR